MFLCVLPGGGSLPFLPPREDGPPVFYLQPCPSFRANGQDLLNDEYRRHTWLSWGLLTSLPPWAGGKPDPIGRWPSSSLSTPLFFLFSFDVFLCFLVVKAQRPKLIPMWWLRPRVSNLLFRYRKGDRILSMPTYTYLVRAQFFKFGKIWDLSPL